MPSIEALGRSLRREDPDVQGQHAIQHAHIVQVMARLRPQAERHVVPRGMHALEMRRNASK